MDEEERKRLEIEAELAHLHDLERLAEERRAQVKETMQQLARNLARLKHVSDWKRWNRGQ
jgi:hypothetical protein